MTTDVNRSSNGGVKWSHPRRPQSDVPFVHSVGRIHTRELLFGKSINKADKKIKAENNT